MLSDINQTEKNKYQMILLMCGVLKRKFIKTNKMMVIRGWDLEG